MKLATRILDIINEMLLTEAASVETYMAQIRKRYPDADAWPEWLEDMERLVTEAIEVLSKNNRVQWFIKQVIFPNADHRMETTLSNSLFVLNTLKDYMTPELLYDIPKIANYPFKDQTRYKVMDDFRQYKEEYEFKLYGDEDPKKLIKPDMWEKGATELISFPNGWKWFNLNTNHSDAEHRSGENCGKCEIEDSILLSLRRPHKVGKETWWKSELTAELTSKSKIRQLRHKNDKPEEKYHPYIMALLLDDSVDVKGFETPHHRHEDTFYVEDLIKEDVNVLKEKKPEMFKAGMEISQVFELHRLWIENNEGGKRADLSGRDLSGGEDFSGVNLEAANLMGTNLRDANLSGANLQDASLGSAYLFDALLIKANLAWAVLSGADLTGADLRGADMTGAILFGVDLTDANLTDANLTDANFKGATLTGVIGANFTGAIGWER